LIKSVIQRNAILTASVQFASAVVQLLLVILIARTLGPEGNGQYAMAIMICQLMASFLNLGVSPSTVYFVGRGDAQPRQAMAENLKIWFPLSISGLLVAAGVLFIHGDTLLPGISPNLIIYGLLAFPVTLLLQYWQAVLQGVENFRAFNLTALLSPVVALIVTVVIVFSTSPQPQAFLMAFVAGQLSGVLVSAVVLLRQPRGCGGDSLLAGYKRKILGYGWRAHLSNIMTFINYRADIFLVNFFLLPTATGVYVIAVQIAERLWIPSQALSTVLLPRLSAMNNESPAVRRRLTVRAAWAVGAITCMIALLGAIALYFLIEPLFGSDYQDAIWPFYWLLPGIIVGAPSRILSTAIAAAGKPEWNFLASLVTVPTNLVFNILLIPLLGIVGAAIATSLAYLANFLIKSWLVSRIAR
jgi:O-antigen/teichoic acid export membrane protein